MPSIADGIEDFFTDVLSTVCTVVRRNALLASLQTRSLKIQAKFRQFKVFNGFRNVENDQSLWEIETIEVLS